MKVRIVRERFASYFVEEQFPSGRWWPHYACLTLWGARRAVKRLLRGDDVIEHWETQS